MVWMNIFLSYFSNMFEHTFSTFDHISKCKVYEKSVILKVSIER